MAANSLTEVVRALAQHREGFSGLFSRMGYWPLLPLLELPHRDVAKGLREAFKDFGLSDAEFERVSLRDLVVFALRSESDYWAGLAVRWIADGFPIERLSCVPATRWLPRSVALRGTDIRCFDSSDDMNRAPNKSAAANGGGRRQFVESIPVYQPLSSAVAELGR